MMFADAKDVETDFISQANRFQQFAETPRGFDGLVGFWVDGGRNETVYADFHISSRFVCYNKFLFDLIILISIYIKSN